MGAERERRPQVPDKASTLFVPTWWQGYLDEAAAKGDATAYRHYWELCTLLALRDGLRSGDVFVPGPRRYDNPAAYCSSPPSGRRTARSSAVWSVRAPTPPRLCRW
ncbi:hypothetical protein ACWC9Q_34955 [Streptomyces sp. NPDC001142]